MNESITTTMNRLYTYLQFSLSTQLPTPSGIHIYSNGATYKDFIASRFPNISFNQSYSAYMLGFDKNGNYKGEEGARIPKPKHKGDFARPLEKMNFGIIKRCTTTAARNVAVASGGKVIINL